MILSSQKRICCLLSICLVLCFIPSLTFAHTGEGAKVTLLNSSLENTRFSVDVGSFDQKTITVNGQDYLAISLDGSGFVQMHKSGQPQIPVENNSIMIPDNAQMDIKVVNSEYYEIQNVDLIPYRGPIPRTVDPATVDYTFGPEYEKDAWFPGDVAKLRDPYIMRDVRGVVAEVYPFQYNPVKKVLRVYSHVEVEVFQTGLGKVNVLDRSISPNKPCATFHAIYQSNFLNASSSRTEPPPESGNLLIISHGPFMTAMQPLVTWKNSIGITTTMVDVATIGNNSNSIKNYIKNEYNKGNLSFVLLVGDHNLVKSNNYSYTVSDPDYTTITPDWYPELLIGRFSAETVAHVETQVQRTIEYEQQGHDVAMGGWNAAALAVASNQGPGHYGEYDDDHCDLMMDELTAYGFTTITKSYDPSGTSAKITTALNDGVRTVQYTGHGYPQGWGNGGGYDNNKVNKLTNTGMLPFVVSVACNVGQFDAGTCFTEAWLRATHNGKPAGAIAHYGSVISQSWDPPMYGQGNHCKNSKLGALERFWKNHNWSIGAQWFGGSCIMMDICGNIGREEFRGWTCFGDPSLRTYGSAGPQTLIADGWSIPVTTGSDITFTIQLGAQYAGYDYFLFAGVTGSDPGTSLPGGAVVPVNFDPVTFILLGLANTTLCPNFHGTLDAAGEASPMFKTTVVAPIDRKLAGTTMYFSAVAWKINGQYEVATNVKHLSIID